MLAMIAVQDNVLIVTDGVRKFEFRREDLKEFDEALSAALNADSSGAKRHFNIANTNVFGQFSLVSRTGGHVELSIYIGDFSDCIRILAKREALINLSFTLG